MAVKKGKIIVRGITGRKMLDSREGKRFGFSTALFISIFFLKEGG